MGHTPGKCWSQGWEQATAFAPAASGGLWAVLEPLSPASVTGAAGMLSLHTVAFTQWVTRLAAGAQVAAERDRKSVV